MHNANSALHGGALCLSKATLAAGTTTTISNTGTITYFVNGIFATKGAMTNAATPTTDANTGAAFKPLPIPTSAADAKGCLFVVGLDIDGNVKVSQGPLVNAADVTNKVSAYAFPPMPDTVCPFGYIKVVAGSTQAAAWTFGTSNLAAGVTGITCTFADIARIPATALTS